MKRPVITLLILFTFIVNAHASGVRTLALNLQQVDSFRITKPKSLPDKTRYVGSTEQWHLFAQTLTSVSHGRPFDNTYAYRVAVKHVNLVNGWKLGADQDATQVHVNRCPMVLSVKTQNDETLIVINKQPKASCLKAN